MSHQNAAERLSKFLREKRLMEGQVIQRRMVGDWGEVLKMLLWLDCKP